MGDRGITHESALQLMRDSIESLSRSGFLSKPCEISESTVLLGAGATLDSIGLVTFIMDFEDRLSLVHAKNVFLVLNEIHEFNADSPSLTAGTLAAYVESLTRKQ